MSDTTKLRAIQEALDAQRPLELDALDDATRESAEQLARVDAWLRTRASSPAFAPSELDDPEAFAARIEARLGESFDDDFDPLAAPDFADFSTGSAGSAADFLAGSAGSAADFGDVEDVGDVGEELEASNVVSIAKARAAASAASPAPSVVDASTSLSGGFAPAPAASAPVAAKVERSTGSSGTGSSSTGRGSFGRWFASAAVVLLAATGSFVAFRSASSPDAAEVAAAPAASSSTVAAAEGFAPPPGAAPTEPTTRFAIEAEVAEEAPTDRRRAENAQALGGALREGAVGGAATGASFEGTPDTTALEPPREQVARARPATRATSTPMPSMAERGAADIWAPAAPAAAAPTMSAPTTAAAARTVTADAPSREVADPAVTEEAAVAEDETGLVRIDRWRSRVLSCVPTIRTLTTRVEARDGRVSAVLETIPTLDAATRGCVETALRGAPLDRPRATLRWKRER